MDRSARGGGWVGGGGESQVGRASHSCGIQSAAPWRGRGGGGSLDPLGVVATWQGRPPPPCRRAPCLPLLRRIEASLLASWRGLDPRQRPLPDVGAAHVGRVPGVTWGDGLDSWQTQELLRTPEWQRSRQVGSVWLTLYLRWAEAELRRRAGERQGGLEVARMLQAYLPR